MRAPLYVKYVQIRRNFPLSYHCEMYSSPMVRTSEVSLSSVLLVMESPSGEREEREGATGAMSM